MSHWNYRILAHHSTAELFFIIHEVHYNDAGIAESYSENGVPAIGESIEDLQLTLNHFQAALDKSILWAGEKFPTEYSKGY